MIAWRAARAFVTWTLLGLMLASCTTLTGHHHEPGLTTAQPSAHRIPSPPPVPEPGPAVECGQGSSATGIKPPMMGLVDRWAPPPEEWREAVPGFVVTVNWQDIHPAPGEFDFDVIDRAVEEAQQDCLQLKLRVLSGWASPEWVKDLDGDRVRILEPQSGLTHQVGRFWEDGHAQAYRALHEALSARYDDAAVLRVVTASLCTTVYAEPFIRQVSDETSRHALLDAGYTVPADLACLETQLEVHDLWQRTRTGLALNPYQRIQRGQSVIDVGPTVRMMTRCREVLGERCVLENNSIRTPSLTGANQEMYAEMARLGAPIAFQTATPERVGDLGATIRWAIDQGASAVELHRDYATDLDRETAVRLTRRLIGNAHGT